MVDPLQMPWTVLHQLFSSLRTDCRTDPIWGKKCQQWCAHWGVSLTPGYMHRHISSHWRSGNCGGPGLAVGERALNDHNDVCGVGHSTCWSTCGPCGTGSAVLVKDSFFSDSLGAYGL